MATIAQDATPKSNKTHGTTWVHGFECRPITGLLLTESGGI